MRLTLVMARRMPGSKWFPESLVVVNRRRISRTAFSTGSFSFSDFCFIFIPFGHYDEPEIFRC